MVAAVVAVVAVEAVVVAEEMVVLVTEVASRTARMLGTARTDD